MVGGRAAAVKQLPKRWRLWYAPLRVTAVRTVAVDVPMKSRALINNYSPFLMVAALLAVLGPARSAVALPLVGDIYVGAGTRSVGGIPGVSASDAVKMAPMLEAGVDKISVFDKWGAGIKAYFRQGGHLSAEVRYTFLALPGLHVLGGFDFGLLGKNSSLDGSFGAFAAGRLTLGLPYLALQVGVYRTPGESGGFAPAAMMTGGLSF